MGLNVFNCVFRIEMYRIYRICRFFFSNFFLKSIVFYKFYEIQFGKESNVPFLTNYSGIIRISKRQETTFFQVREFWQFDSFQRILLWKFNWILAVQWRIQDFPEGVGAPTPKVSVLFSKFFAENCTKMKEFGPRGGMHHPWHPFLDPPMTCILKPW